MNNETPDNSKPEPGILAKGFGAIVLAVFVILIVMIVGGVLGVILQMVFEPVLGAGARAFAFMGPVAIVGAWIYAKYYTSKGNGNPKQRPVALAGVAAFAVLMTIWFINEPPVGAHNPREDAETLAKPCTEHGISRLICESNKDAIKRRQDGGR
jgi:hypothetical protein